jgi:hypothetical protein
MLRAAMNVVRGEEVIFSSALQVGFFRSREQTDAHFQCSNSSGSRIGDVTIIDDR